MIAGADDESPLADLSRRRGGNRGPLPHRIVGGRCVRIGISLRDVDRQHRRIVPTCLHHARQRATELISSDARAILTTGVMGGFTTYSTFNYETTNYLREGAWLPA